MIHMFGDIAGLKDLFLDAQKITYEFNEIPGEGIERGYGILQITGYFFELALTLFALIKQIGEA